MYVQYASVFTQKQAMCESLNDNYLCNCNWTPRQAGKCGTQTIWTVSLFGDLHTKTVQCCRTVRQQRKGMPKNFEQKMKLKQDDIKTKVWGTCQPYCGMMNKK